MLLVIVLAMGCSQRLFQFVASFQEKAEYFVEGSSFNETAYITENNIRDAFDIPDDGVIREVKIESVYLKLSGLYQNHTATSMHVNAYIQRPGGQKLYVYRDNVILSNPNVPFYGAANWIPTTIQELQQDLNSYFSDHPNPDIELHLEGSTDPAGSVADASLDFYIKIAVKYDQCVETLDIFGEDCNL